jgi:glycosyltransferase involved in cell wall biosynthesis
MNKRLIVVLGMHRSGTSAMIRGLKDLGVDLGQNLMPPSFDQNITGFWEDQDINAFNVELLCHLTDGFHANMPGQEWHSITPICNAQLKSKELAAFRLKAIFLLRDKVKNSTVFGIKDPRMCRLLPFWKDVFAHLNLNVSYIIVSRNPLSVAQSLRKRNGFQAEKCHYLWLEHLLSSMIETTKHSRIVVDYDLLIDQPGIQLLRVAQKLDLAESLVYPQKLEDYKDNFIDKSLRHNAFHLEDLELDPSIPQDAIEAYDLLIKLANDELSESDLETQEKFIRLDQRLHAMTPSLQYITNLEDQIAMLSQAVADRDEIIININQSLADRESQIHILNLVAMEHVETIKHVNETLVDRDEIITTINQSLADRESQIHILNLVAMERAETIKHVNETLVDRDRQIYQFELSIAEYNRQAELHNQWLCERDERIDRLNQIVTCYNNEIQELSSFRITKPIALIGHPYKRIQYAWRLLPQVLTHTGGIKSATRKIVHTLIQEGLQGCKKRLISMKLPSVIMVDDRKIDIHNYGEWVRRYDMLDDAAQDKIIRHINSWPVKPKISVILPVYNPQLDLLDKAIESIKNQLYSEWELCIADDASENQVVRKLLQQHAKKDKRIRVIYRQKNGHISAASNSAIEISTGEYLALLDHDDLLPEHALYEIAKVILSHPDAGIIYSDEDKIDLEGLRHAPYFKCDWNPQLFLSHNLISHLGVYKASLVRKLAGFRIGFEGSQDYDLALRCIEHLDQHQIIHIPKILYHWRVHVNSTATSAEAKPYALINGKKAIDEHLVRCGISGESELLEFNMYRVRYHLPARPPLVSLIIPTRNSLNLIKQCINSLKKTSYPNYEIIIIDNASDDAKTLSYLKSLKSNKRINVFRDERPFNYSALNNAAVKQARGELIGLINNDIEVISGDWLTEMVSLAIQPGAGAVGAKLWYPNNTLQHGGVILGMGGVAGHSHRLLPKGGLGYFGRASILQNLSAVTAACLIVLKSSFERVGGLNETELAVAFNDIDFCLRLREEGYRNIWTPYAELYHHESASRGFDDTPEKQARFLKEARYMMKRWDGHLLNDPAYNPNLTLDYQDFGLAWPPRVDLY